jgi:SnoaL-like domain
MSDPRIARLLDEHDLRRSAELYAQGADRRDRALWRSIMTEDCVIEAPGVELVGRERVVAALDLLEKMYPRTQHRVHNQVVTIDGDAAHGETYCTADHVKLVDGRRTVSSWAIRYQDRWRREGGQWRFAKRTLVVDWTETRTLD